MIFTQLKDDLNWVSSRDN